MNAKQKSMLAELSNSSYRATEHDFVAFHPDGSSTSFRVHLVPGWSGQDHLFDRTLAALETRLEANVVGKSLSKLNISDRNGRPQITDVSHRPAPEKVAGDYLPSCRAEALALWAIVERAERAALDKLEWYSGYLGREIDAGVPAFGNVNDSRRHAWPEAPWEFQAEGGQRHFATREDAEAAAVIVRAEITAKYTARRQELSVEIAAEKTKADARLSEIRTAWGLSS